MKGNQTALVWKEEFLQHETGLHPEKKERLLAIRDRLEKTGYYKNLLRPEIYPATIEDLVSVHEPAYVDQFREKCAKGRAGFMDPDTPYSEGTFQAALLASGAGICLSDLVWEGKAQNGLALVRPPGHHAFEEGAMGFCFFNHIAIAARYLQRKGAKRILILDWDVHHGNGTESIFYDDGSVYFISLHQYPFYPGTGHSADRGVGEGLGKNLNCPLPRGSGESAYKREFFEKIFPEIDAFQPEIILISAGFDAHKNDPLGGMELTEGSFENFTWWIQEKANEHCQGRVVSFLEGGYDLRALADSVEAHLSVLADT